jgi:transposase
MAKAYPKEFRDYVVAVARKGQGQSAQIAKDFGISEGALSNWLKRADIEDGRRPGANDAVARYRAQAHTLIGLL